MTDQPHQHDPAAEMRELPDQERQRLIVYGVLMGKVVDGRPQFRGRRVAA